MSQPQQPAVESELKEVEMKTGLPIEEEEPSHIEHPLYEEALEEEDVKPESAIDKFKQVIDERQPPHSTHRTARHTNQPSLAVQWTELTGR